MESDSGDERRNRVWVCRVCGNENGLRASRCRNCWANRSDETERTAARRVSPSHTRRTPGRQVIVWAAVCLAVIILAVWYILPRVGVALFYISPVSDISSAPVSGEWPMYQRDPRA